MNEKQGSTVLVVETKPDIPSFLDDKVNLKKLAQTISTASSKAVAVLLTLLDSKDERVRLQAATKLVEFQIQVAKEISSDQMQRLIAEIKLVRAPTKKLVGVDDPDSPRKPIVDFSTIRQIN